MFPRPGSAGLVAPGGVFGDVCLVPTGTVSLRGRWPVGPRRIAGSPECFWWATSSPLIDVAPVAIDHWLLINILRLSPVPSWECAGTGVKFGLMAHHGWFA